MQGQVARRWKQKMDRQQIIKVWVRSWFLTANFVIDIVDGYTKQFGFNIYSVNNLVNEPENSPNKLSVIL